MDYDKVDELVVSAKDGNQLAFEQLHHEFKNFATSKAFSYLHNRSDAEEIAQDAFMSVYKNLSRIDEPRTFASFLGKTISNKCIDFSRKKKLDTSCIDDVSEDVRKDDINTPDKCFESKELGEALMTIIKSLPSEQKDCIIAYYYKNLSVKEVAEHFNIKETTVKNRLDLARKKIRKEVVARKVHFN